MFTVFRIDGNTLESNSSSSVAMLSQSAFLRFMKVLLRASRLGGLESTELRIVCGV